MNDTGTCRWGGGGGGGIRINGFQLKRRLFLVFSVFFNKIGMAFNRI